MSKAIWKYPLEITGEQGITMPKGAKIIAVGNQYENLALWAIVNPEQGGIKEFRKIYIYGTGHSTDEIKGSYIGTVLMRDGSLVWHIFEEEK